MRRSPLVALLLSFSFALQLVLARDGTTCVMPGAEDHAGAMPGMVGMSVMDMSMDVSQDSEPPGSSCDHEATATACLVMAPCANGFLTIAAVVNQPAGVLAERISTASVVMPPSRFAPPEPPPPRA